MDNADTVSAPWSFNIIDSVLANWLLLRERYPIELLILGTWCVCIPFFLSGIFLFHHLCFCYESSWKKLLNVSDYMKYSPNISFIWYHFFYLIVTFNICIQTCNQIESSLGPEREELVLEMTFTHVKLMTWCLSCGNLCLQHAVYSRRHTLNKTLLVKITLKC